MIKPPSFFLLSLFFINISYGIGYDSDLSPTNCPHYEPCDDNLTIKYPFWRTDNDTASNQYCGYRNFGLSCSNGKTILRLPPDHTFHVKYINYINHSIKLVDIDQGRNPNCPRQRHNLTLETLPLNYSKSDLTLSFYFNCTYSPFPGPPKPPIDCLRFEAKQSYVNVLAGDETGQVNWFGRCEENVRVTVLRAYVPRNDLIFSKFGGTMGQGFMLDWRTVKECGACEASEGNCGSSKSEKDFLCFCKDGKVRSKPCRGNDTVTGNPEGEMKGNNLDVGRKVKIALGASLGTVIIMLTAFFFWYRRKKRQYVSFVSQSIKSVPSSKAHMEKRGSFNGVHLFSYEELEEATSNFDETRELGDGGFGTVYYGKLLDGREVAVKRLYENNYKRLEQFLNEVDILTRLRHKNLVLLYGCTSRHSRELLLVYEYIPNGTLADHLHGERAKPGALPWPTRMNIAVETASALAYLHASVIVHRDVKTNNILLDNNFCVKVADFGLSRLFPTDVTHVSTAPQGTPGYVDPEYHQCYQLTDKSDVYSFGVVLIELISSMPAVDIARHRHEINLSNMAISKIQSNALNELVDPSLGFESDYAARKMISAVAELAFQCLQSAKELRPSMEEVLKVLKDVQSRDYSALKVEEIAIPSDDVGLLKSGPRPISPDTVTGTWISTSTTPNGSG